MWSVPSYYQNPKILVDIWYTFLLFISYYDYMAFWI